MANTWWFSQKSPQAKQRGETDIYSSLTLTLEYLAPTFLGIREEFLQRFWLNTLLRPRDKRVKYALDFQGRFSVVYWEEFPFLYAQLK